jgi:hypothetical protein
MRHDTAEVAKTVLDALSVATVVATLIEVLPSIAALFTICWTGIRIWETDTVRKLTGRGQSNAVDE